MTNLYNGWETLPKINERERAEQNVNRLTRLAIDALAHVSENLKSGWYDRHPGMMITDRQYLDETREELKVALRELETIVA